jgi:hypothetical protein
MERLFRTAPAARPGTPPAPARSPGGLLALQRAAGNRAVGQRLLAVQRSDPPAPYVAHPAVLADCVSLLQRVYTTQSTATLAVLRSWKTVAIGAVVDPDEPDVTKYHWSAAGNWNDQGIAAAMAALGVRRWDADPARQPRGPQGAPGDAEQRLMSGADTLKAVAVSRPPCGDCAAALAAYGTEYGQVLLAVVPPPTEREQQARTAAVQAIRETAVRVRQQLELYEGEHKAQTALIDTPSFTGFAGYWTNRLFNRPIPPPTIWINAYGSLLAVEGSLGRGNLREAIANLIRARRQLLVALRRYAAWKDGIEAAGTKAQLAIGAVAIATVVAVIAGPAVVEAAIEAFAGGAEAGAGAAEEQVAVRVASTVAQYDQAMLAWEAQVAEAEIEAEALAETNEFYASLGL